MDEESRWHDFADRVGFVLAIYTRRRETLVDVLLVDQAFVTERGKLILVVAAPKLVKDQYAGAWLEWEKHFELPRDALLHHDALHFRGL